MSASYVRNLFRQWAQTVAAATGVNVFDTINREAKPADAVWWTYEFVAEYYEGTFCERGYIERGFIRVTVLAQPGTGDSAAILALEAIVPQLMASVDPTQRLVLESYEPVTEPIGGDATSEYRVSVILDYAYSL